MSEFGLRFNIGARLSSSVASAFSSVDSRMRQTQQVMRNLADTSRTMRNALDLRQRRESLRQQYIASGRTDSRLLDQLREVSASYRRARTAALAYGASVDEWRARHERANAELNRTRTRMERLRAIQSERGARQEIYGNLLETAAPVAGMVMPLKLAIDFESGMADAAKTMDGMRDESGNLTPRYYEMQNIIKSMGRELPLAHEEIARLFAAGGQLGMSDVDELKQFSTMSAHMAVAFGMSSEEAAESIGTFRTSLKMSLKDVGGVLDLMNQYANTSSAKEKDIAETLRRIGSLGNVAGISAKPMTALAATLAAVGTAPDVAATGIKNMLLAMTKGTAATKGQKEAFAKLNIDTVKLAKDMQRDGPAAVLAVLKEIQKLERYQQTSIMNELFGSESLTAITPFLDNMELAIRNLELVDNESAYAGAMQKEFANRAKTTANALQLAKNRVAELGVNLGSALLPPLNRLLSATGPLISAFSDWVAANPRITTGLMAVAGGLAAVKTGMLAARLLASGVRSSCLTVRDSFSLLGGGMSALGRGARRAAGIFAFSWRQAFSPAVAGAARLRAGMASLRASVASAAARLRSLGAAGIVAGTRAMVAGGMARASRAGWNALRLGLRGVGAAFRVAFGPMSLLLTGLTLGVDYLIANWDRVAPYFTAMWERLKAIFAAGLSWLQPVVDTIGKGLSMVGEAWDWAFGNDEKKEAGITPLGEKAGAAPLGEKAAVQPLPPEPPRQSLLSRAWDWAFGDDEETKQVQSAPEPESPRKAQRAQPSPLAVEPMGDKVAVHPTPGPDSLRKTQLAPTSPPAVESLKEKANLQPLAERQAAPPEKRETSRPDVPRPASPSSGRALPGKGDAPSVTVQMNFQLQGMPDAAFAEGVIRALKGRSREVETLISGIVHNQARLAYGC